MTLQELQKTVVDILNADETLRAGGALAIVEDSLSYVYDVERQLNTVGGVAVVVLTPSAIRTADGGDDHTKTVTVDPLIVSAVEMVAVNRLRPGAITALQAAQRAADLLDGTTFSFSSISQTVSPEAGTLKAEANFGVTITLGKEM